jgi:tRNA-specific 2-thiouridylase
MVLRDQGIEVEWITFETPFFSSASARRAAGMLKVPLTVENITPIYLEMVKKPNCGYGRNMNPCLDCHCLMFKQAGRYLEKKGFDFLFSGEVLGQRPMSQKKGSLRYVEKHSGFDGHILRPLSARNLPESIPEKEGLVDRERLLDISGRSRKVQLGLAEKYGITEFPAPAGGCLLTDPGFANRLRDLFDHQERTPERELHLLKHGRHLRLYADTKAIVGRTKMDNADIRRYLDAKRDTVVDVADFPGPTVLIPGGGGREAVLLAAAICAGYSKAPNDRPAKVNIVAPSGRETIEVLPIPTVQASRFLI